MWCTDYIVLCTCSTRTCISPSTSHTAAGSENGSPTHRTQFGQVLAPDSADYFLLFIFFSAAPPWQKNKWNANVCYSKDVTVPKTPFFSQSRHCFFSVCTGSSLEGGGTVSEASRSRGRSLGWFCFHLWGRWGGQTQTGGADPCSRALFKCWAQLLEGV